MLLPGRVRGDPRVRQRARSNWHARITVRILEFDERNAEGNGRATVKRYETTVGRAICPRSCRRACPSSAQPLKKKEILEADQRGFRRCGLRETVIFADQLMQAGFRLATRAGISIAVDDMLVRRDGIR